MVGDRSPSGPRTFFGQGSGRLGEPSLPEQPVSGFYEIGLEVFKKNHSRIGQRNRSFLCAFLSLFVAMKQLKLL
jgi:hypothetical protein